MFVWSRRLEKFPIRLTANNSDQAPSDDKLRLKSGIKKDNFKAVMKPTGKLMGIKCNRKVVRPLKPDFPGKCGINYREAKVTVARY